MEPLTAEELRHSFVNSSRSLVQAMSLPRGFGDLPWEDLDYLGWRDPKAPARAYLVVRRDGALTGVALTTATSGQARRGAGLCDWCHTAHPLADVALFVARRAGTGGKQGNTVGSYACADLACSLYLRGRRELQLPQGETGSVAERVDRLRRRLDTFVNRVLA